MINHVARITRGANVHRAVSTFTVYNNGRITMAGLRTPQMAAQIAAIGAVNDVSDETMALMLNEHTFRKRYWSLLYMTKSGVSLLRIAARTRHFIL